MRLAKTGVSGSHNGGFSPKISGHDSFLRRFEKHDRRTADLANESGHVHVDDNVAWGDSLYPTHHPDAFFQFNHAHVVVAAMLGLPAHDGGGMDPPLAAGEMPGDRSSVTERTQNPGKEVMFPAVIAFGKQDFLVCECALENLVWSCGVRHLRSPSSDPFNGLACCCCF
jgi:hypothetical protein